MQESYILLFIFAGVAWAGLGAIILASFIGIRRLITPKQHVPDPNRWSRDWERLERDLSE